MGKQCWSQAVLESGSWVHSVLQTPALVLLLFVTFRLIIFFGQLRVLTVTNICTYTSAAGLVSRVIARMNDGWLAGWELVVGAFDWEGCGDSQVIRLAAIA